MVSTGSSELGYLQLLKQRLDFHVCQVTSTGVASRRPEPGQVGLMNDSGTRVTTLPFFTKHSTSLLSAKNALELDLKCMPPLLLPHLS